MVDVKEIRGLCFPLLKTIARQNINFFKIQMRNFRALYYFAFRTNYVIESLKARKGFCKQCGCCGEEDFICKNFNSQNKKCPLWNRLPLICKIYPFDEKDKSTFSKANCGFYWKKE